ncbi:hypothetical protein ACIBLA_25640 [Streptomyces sp. NPDC050433]|uniref:hypothetical protein n=1 Tax=Streptomyces sp. NPDC050433 TaxID=3365615 RepID=UPI0037B7045C
MPFTALHPDNGRLDATQHDLGCGLDWNNVCKASPRVSLACPECGWGVYAKHSPRRVRFFCHDPGRPVECSLTNESWEHHMLKLEMAGEREAAAARRKQHMEEIHRRRRAEGARQRRLVQEQEHRIRMEKLRERWAEEEALRARERAEQKERERQAVETARAWWSRLSQEQIKELFATVADRAWREEQLRVEVPENASMAAHFAYGVPLHSQGRFRALYGIVRPCPDLISLSPQLPCQRVFVRKAHELRELGTVLTGRITHFDLPDHEQLAMC